MIDVLRNKLEWRVELLFFLWFPTHHIYPSYPRRFLIPYLNWCYCDEQIRKVLDRGELIQLLHWQSEETSFRISFLTRLVSLRIFLVMT